MRIFTPLAFTISFLLLYGAGYRTGYAQPQSKSGSQPKKLDNGSVLLENFQHDTPGKLPYGWYDRDGNKRLPNHDTGEQATYKYKVRKEGANKFLRYEGTQAKHMNYPLVNDDGDNIYNLNIYETPILSWKWRAFNLPKEGNEDDSDKNDAVASVYVVFGFGHVLFKKVPKTIRYSWSSTLPENKELSKFFGNQKIIVVESGPQRTGKWITFERNIVEDYRRLFGDDPPQDPLAILILSDGDSTGSLVKADYDDIMLKPGR